MGGGCAVAASDNVVNAWVEAQILPAAKDLASTGRCSGTEKLAPHSELLS